jgi:hypothetical protein
MLTQGAGDLFHGLDTRPQELAAPFVEELASPGGRVVIPELLKGSRVFEQAPEIRRYLARNLHKPIPFARSDSPTVGTGGHTGQEFLHSPTPD